VLIAIVVVVILFRKTRKEVNKTAAEAAQARAEAAQQRLGLLAEASNTLASSLDNETRLPNVAQLMVPTLADCCAVDLVDEDGRIRCIGFRCEDSGLLPRARDEWQHQPIGADGTNPVAVSTRTGRSLRYPNPDESAPPADWQCLETLGFRSALIIPLVIGGRTLGAISFLATSPQRYGDADQALAEELSRRAALAIENARLYRATQSAVHARDEFLSVAAHELKTPVTSLRGFAQLALRRLDADGWVEPKALRKALETVARQSEKLARLVGQLLDISRVEAGMLALDRQPIDLVEVMNGLVASARVRTDRHTVVLCAPASAHAVVDSVRLEQVVTNLLDNAIKYSSGGEILVELSVISPETVQLALRDHGVGIPFEKRKHIFDRFYQAHETSHRSSLTGMGLGLYISRQIIELHGGEIHAEFPPDGGSRFVVTLPGGR